MRWLLRPYTEPGFYRAIGFFLLGLPLAIFEYTVVITGLSVGAGLAITLLGIPIILATLLVASAMATFERELAAGMLGAAMPRRFSRRDTSGFGWMRLWARVRDRRTWSELAFLLLLRLPMGIAGFVLVVTLGALAVGIIAQPILIAAGVTSQFGGWTIDTFAESLVFAPLSLLVLLVGPRLVLGWAAGVSRITTGVLGWLDPTDLKHGIVDALARLDSADAFALLDEVGLMFGTGPFLTLTKIEATLLALESSGVIRASHNGSRTIYSLRETMAIR